MSDQRSLVDIKKQWYEQQFVRAADIDVLIEAAIGTERPDPEQMELVPAVSTLRACQKFSKLIDAGIQAWADMLTPAILMGLGQARGALDAEVRRQRAELDRRPLAPPDKKV